MLSQPGGSHIPAPTPTKVSEELEPLRLITWKELQRIVPYVRQHILRLEKAGKFPKRRRVGPNRVGWHAKDIEAWLLALEAGSAKAD
jgi:prophage regulatory protein